MQIMSKQNCTSVNCFPFSSQEKHSFRASVLKTDVSDDHVTQVKDRGKNK